MNFQSEDCNQRLCIAGMNREHSAGTQHRYEHVAPKLAVMSFGIERKMGCHGALDDCTITEVFLNVNATCILSGQAHPLKALCHNQVRIQVRIQKRCASSTCIPLHGQLFLLVGGLTVHVLNWTCCACSKLYWASLSQFTRLLELDPVCRCR